MRRHRKTDNDNGDEHDIIDESEMTETVETIETSEISPRNELPETVDSPNVIVCYKTYGGYDETFTEYLKDEDDNSAAE